MIIWRGVLLILWSCIVLAEDRTVFIDQGPIRGYKPSGEDYFVFYDIPYATAPTGPDKFKAPLPPPIWNETFEAVQKNIICPQPPLEELSHLNAQEDCLITNIYVPDTDKSNLTVLIYFHGGSFQRGYGNTRTAINLLKSKQLIILNFNYRLGAHGFLCLGTKNIPGNAGMKDQVALLRWVQRNIASFGGNPNDITLVGCSAGASSVDLIMISKTTKGLCHKIIPESGSNSMSFSVQVDPVANAKMIARELKFYDINNLEALENFYKNITHETFYSIDVSNRPDSTVFAPCVERDLGEEMFLDDYPINILKSGNFPKLPMLYGVTDMEGMYRVPNLDLWKDMMNEKFSDFLPEDLGFANENERQTVSQMIKHFYFNDQPVGTNTIINYIKYFTDAMFRHGTAKSVSLHVEAGNNQIYLYEYSFVDEDADFIPYTNIRGATHCAQSHAVMDMDNEENLSDEYKNTKKVMRDLWLSFILTGHPVPKNSSYPEWPPVGQNRSPYMSLNTTLELRSPFLPHSGIFWDQIYSKYYKAPIPPTSF